MIGFQNKVQKLYLQTNIGIQITQPLPGHCVVLQQTKHLKQARLNQTKHIRTT